MTPIITYTAALNPCFNVNGVDFLIESISSDLKFFDDGFASKSKSYFKEYLKGLYNLYYEKYGIPTQSSQASGGATSSKASGGNNYSRLLNGLKAHTKKARIDPTMSSEFERYVNSDFVTHLHPKEFATFDVLGFWKEKETIFPVLSRMAMDLISVQASSVASEFAFSTSGMVLSIRRTRLTPASLEMCMCLKDHLDAKEHELVKIMECHKTAEQTAYPVFLDVEPTEVRKQSGAVGEAFVKHKKVKAAGKWRDAMKEVANLAGWELKETANRDESELVRIIVDDIFKKLSSNSLNVDGKLVGMDMRINEVLASLKISTEDILFIGIKGMGGGGKTTLARAVYDHISSEFEDQLEALAGKPNWFKSGRTIIITTRDEQVLVSHGV
nr:TMV resistance protein N-like [Tanacetum cinerariifolium]